MSPSELSHDDDGGSRPVPDPTLLTTAALNAAIGALRTEIRRERECQADLAVEKAKRNDERFALLETSIHSRLEGLDTLEKERAVKYAAEIAARFKAVEQRFDLQEQQRVEQKNDTKAAVAAALAAAKEAVKEQTIASSLATQKSETATNKNLEQQAASATTEAASLRRQIDELKERIGDSDRNSRQSVTDLDRSLRMAISEVSQTSNGFAARVTGHGSGLNDAWGYVVGFGGLVIAALGIAAAVLR